MSRKPKTLASAASGVQAVLKTSDLWQALRPHMAKAKWADVVGPQVAGVTQVEKVEGTKLVVRVKNSTWAHELTFLKGDILRRLNLALGGPVLSDIRFKGGGLAREKASPRLPAHAALPGGDVLAQIRLSGAALGRVEAVVQSISDEALRARVRASLLRAARLEAWKRAREWRPCVRCGALSPPDDASPVCALCRVVPVNSTAPRF